MIDITQLDIDSINSCLIPEYFCDVCCNYNIGPSDENGRETCVNKCRMTVGAMKTNVFELEYILEVNMRKVQELKDKQEEVLIN